MRDTKTLVRTMLAARRYSIRQLTEEYNARMGTTLTMQGMAYKISHETMKLNEFLVVCDILNFNVIVEAKDTHVRLLE